MKRTRVHILSAVNSSAVTKEGGTFTIRGVCGAIDELVMNGVLYPGQELAEGVASMEGKPAPAGHPKNAKGQHISALNGEALASAWIGSYCRNARHEGGRTLVDVVVNEAQAKAHPDGAKLVERLEAAVNGTQTDPIHVSTGLLCRMLEVNGESRGKKYSRVATGIQYDHLAILLNQRGAGTPEDGVGMFLNSEGTEEPVEVANLDAEPADARERNRLTSWIKRLLGNSELSFSDISTQLQKGLPDGCWLMEVYDRYAVWCGRDNRLWRQDYETVEGASVAWAGSPIEVARRVSYEPVTNLQEEEPDAVKEHIVAALNAAGIKTEGLDDAQLLSAYNALVNKPIADQLAAVNSKLAEREAAERAAEEAEVSKLAEQLAVNSSLTVDDLKKLGAARLRELSAKAAPVVPGQAGAAQSQFTGYSINALIDKKEA